jgi:hypothetical protein
MALGVRLARRRYSKHLVGNFQSWFSAQPDYLEYRQGRLTKAELMNACHIALSATV